MGSSGSGKFGTYRIGGSGGDGGTLGEFAGASNEIECPKILENVKLEDVATSNYFLKQKALPTAGSQIQIRETVYLGRVVVETVDEKEVIGNLPTQYNYILNCIKSGMHYAGKVISSDVLPVPFIVVTLNA